MILQYSQTLVGPGAPASAACELGPCQTVEHQASQQLNVACWNAATHSQSLQRQRVTIRRRLLTVVLLNDILLLVSCTFESY